MSPAYLYCAATTLDGFLADEHDGLDWLLSQPLGQGGLLGHDTFCARAGMLDEVLVSIAPVTLGAGRPLLGGAFDLELLEHGRNEAFLEARYRLVGERA